MQLGVCGYDGFNIGFIKEIWGRIRKHITQFVKQFFICGVFPKSINTTWVTLVPKKNIFMRIQDFRPISVVSSLYKIISKVVAIRLKPIIGEVISENQTSFIQKRSILMVFSLTMRVYYGLRRRKRREQYLKQTSKRPMTPLDGNSLNLC